MQHPAVIFAFNFAFPVFCMAGSLTYVVYRLCHSFGKLDVPNHRSSHDKPKALMGGAAIAFSFMAGILAYRNTHLGLPASTATLIAFLVIALAVAAIGLLDDLWGLSPRLRFLLQFVFGTATIVAVLLFDQKVVSPIHLALMPFALLWIVGNINAYNFMDGIDGMAAGNGIIYAITIGIAGYLLHMPDFLPLGIILAASMAGFLVFNAPPARIFMGDVGSTFLGYIVAAMGVLLSMIHETYILVPATAMTPFIYDTMSVVLRRQRRGEHLTTAHRKHLYQRLVRSGWNHGQATILYLGLSILSCAVALFPLMYELTPLILICYWPCYAFLYGSIERRFCKVPF